MAAPVISWLKVKWVNGGSGQEIISPYIEEPMTVQDAKTANLLPSGADIDTFVSNYGSRKIWNAGIVEAGKSSITGGEMGEFLICNNLAGAADIHDAINCTLNVTDKEGGSTDGTIANKTGAILYFRMAKWAGTKMKYGYWDRSNPSSPSDSPFTDDYDIDDDPGVSASGWSEVTYTNSVIVDCALGDTANVVNGGTIHGSAANWTGDNPKIDFDDTSDQSSSTDMSNYARVQFAVFAKPTADAGTVLFIIRLNYQYE